MHSYELLVVGSGPAGVQAALRARQAGRRAAIVERMEVVGGTCIHLGTIPSKTLRQAVLDLTGFRYRELSGTDLAPSPPISMRRLKDRCLGVIAAEAGWQSRMLVARGVDVIRGQARFLDPHTLKVGGSKEEVSVHGEQILLAVGSVPQRPAGVRFDGRRILDSDHVLGIEELPRSMVVIGGGVVGVEYASIFSMLDVKITLVHRGPTVLPFVDEAIRADLEQELRAKEADVLVGTAFEEITADEKRARVRLTDGRTIEADAVLFCAGRRGAAPDLDLERAGLTADEGGRLEVDSDFRTSVPHVFAAGDVIGFPSLASTSREQGRVAACRALGVPCRPVEELLPFGIYTLPEIAFVGPSEESARAAGIDVATGVGAYADTARGQIIGDTRGRLVLVVDKADRRLAGAHMIGTGATELVHLAQMAIAFGAPYNWFVRMVMNYPTLSRIYKLAAWDLLEKLGD